MKKSIFSIMFAMMMSMIICSCTNGGTAVASDADSTTIDSIDSIEVVDSTVSIAIDSVSVDTVCVD